MDESTRGTTLAIMQPYFLPYIGYWQLIAAVDTFIIYDNIKYTKKGWINRNRMLRNGEAVTFSLPVAAGSDSLDVVQRELAPGHDRRKLLAQFDGAYAKAPHYEALRPLLASVINCPEQNLYRHVRHSVDAVCQHLGLTTRILTSSEVAIHHELRAQDKVLALCQAVQAHTYINPIGGTELYDAETFARHGIALKFLKARPIEYPQWGAPFVPWLSIVDLLAFNPLEIVQDWVRTQFDYV
ncbi:WbqC family protein [Roseateles sp. DB2]|uniref:WbqC family protein n=1 Tax=Roseateles sp. DB2 TaxID=3453717 RepID=UPI003EEF504B